MTSTNCQTQTQNSRFIVVLPDHKSVGSHVSQVWKKYHRPFNTSCQQHQKCYPQTQIKVNLPTMSPSSPSLQSHSDCNTEKAELASTSMNHRWEHFGHDHAMMMIFIMMIMLMTFYDLDLFLMTMTICNHREGGWPKDVKTELMEQKNKFIRKVENRNVKNVQCLMFNVQCSTFNVQFKGQAQFKCSIFNV